MNSHEKLSKTLGIDLEDNDLDQLDPSVESSLTPEEVDAREKELLRQQMKDEVAQLNQEIDNIVDEDDEDFIKKSYKLVASKGFKILNQAQKEIENDPRERTIEVASQVMGAVTKAVESLDGYNKGKEQLKQSREKIDLRRQEVEGRLGGGGGGQNTIMIGTTNDIIQQFLDQSNQPEQQIEAEVEDVEPEE